MTTRPWSLQAIVRHLTLRRGWNPLLLTRLPSKPRAALRICAARTQTHTWQRNPSSDSRERSASRCEAGRWERPVTPQYSGWRLELLLGLCGSCLSTEQTFSYLEACLVLMLNSASLSMTQSFKSKAAHSALADQIKAPRHFLCLLTEPSTGLNVVSKRFSYTQIIFK